MLATTYFGEDASVHLCMQDGTVIACSDTNVHHGNLLDMLIENSIIDQETGGRQEKFLKMAGKVPLFAAQKVKQIISV